MVDEKRNYKVAENYQHTLDSSIDLRSDAPGLCTAPEYMHIYIYICIPLAHLFLCHTQGPSFTHEYCAVLFCLSMRYGLLDLHSTGLILVFYSRVVPPRLVGSFLI